MLGGFLPGRRFQLYKTETMGTSEKIYSLLDPKVPVSSSHLSKRAECQRAHKSMQCNYSNYYVQSCAPTTTNACASLRLWVFA